MSKFDDIKIPDNIDEVTKVAINRGKNEKYRGQKITKLASIIVVGGMGILLGSGVLSSKPIWANIEKIWHSMQSLLDLKQDEISNYKYEINKSVESQDIKVTYKNFMIDDGNLIIEMNIDDNKFNPFEDFTKEQQKDWYVDKWGNKKRFITLGADCLEAYIDGEKRTISGGQSNDDAKIESDGSTSIIMQIPVNEIDKGEQGIDEVGTNQFPYSIDKNKIYNIKLNTKKIHLTTGWIDEDEMSYGGAIRSNWSIDLPIKGEELLKATINYDDYNINQNIKISIDGIEKEINISSLHLSPINAKLKYTTDMSGYYIGDNYDIEIRLENENGEEFQAQYLTSNYDETKQRFNAEIIYRNIFKDTQKVKIKPILTNLKTGELIEQESITINLNDK